MRVIAGTARGMPLRSPSFDGTRPITDRAKEALFSILMPRLRDGPFLDLFAGTGGVGIEALSRGVERATFVELNRAAVGDLRANLNQTRLVDGAVVVHGDVFGFLRGTPAPHAVVFVSPPQWQGLWLRALGALDANPGWVATDGVVVVQCDPREIEDVELAHFERASVRRYANVALLLYVVR